MYEDGWYSIAPEITSKKPSASSSQAHGHQRKESLLQQPNGTGKADAGILHTLNDVLEEVANDNSPPEPTLPRRAASYSDFYHVVRAQLSKDAKRKTRQSVDRKERSWDALMVHEPETKTPRRTQRLADELGSGSLDEELLAQSQQEYLLYRDQLTLTERHLQGLISDSNETLKLLTTLSNSFKSVEAQTSSFQKHCEELVTEQQRLETLANEVGTDLHYYAYLETATRRLNAPGASKLVDDDDFGDMVANIESCISFMSSHESYRERDSYLARYNALLTKALHLLDHGFNNRLEKVSADIARQINAAKTESARHVLAYGRFEEMIKDTYSLLPNIQKVVRSVYDQHGLPKQTTPSTPILENAITNMFRTYLSTRDANLKVITQHDLSEYQKEVKSLSVETATRNHIKQAFERVYNEDGLFVKIFNISLVWNTNPESAFQSVKTIHTAMVHPGNLEPLAANVKSVLQAAEIQEVGNVVGWLTSEYAIAESDEEDSPSMQKYREYAARLLAHSLWPFVDGIFEAEITKSITKATFQDDSLKIGPVTDGVSSSNAFPLVKKAVELLVMFDHAMPKDRSSKNSAVVFKIVRETIQVLQRAESRIKALKKSDPDPGLFMVKNLLIIKNELVSLEIGDIRDQPPSMQHFGQIWETLSPHNLVGFFGNIIGGQLWSRGAPSVTAKTLTAEDMSEQLDELLRQSIYEFTKRWGTLMADAQARKVGVKPIAKVESELEKMLQTAFSNQPEVIAKLKEAIQMNAQAQTEASDAKNGARRY